MPPDSIYPHSPEAGTPEQNEAASPNGVPLDPEQQRLHRLRENEILAQFHRLLERLEIQNDAFTPEEIAADLKAAGLE